MDEEKTRKVFSKTIVDYNFKATSKRKIHSEEENKSERRMPRLLEAMKDVVSCEKLRGSANRN